MLTDEVDEAEAQDNATEEADEKFTRLFKSVEHSYSEMSQFREKRVDFLKQYVGRHYYKTSETSDVPVPINLIELEVSTIVRRIAAKAPNVKVRSRGHAQLRSKAQLFQLALNQLIKQIKLKKTFKLVAINSYFAMGMVKIGIEQGKAVTLDEGEHTYGQPFVQNVDLDDMVVDMSCNSLEHGSYIGDRYFLPLEEVQNNPMFDPECTAKLKPYDGTGFEKKNSDKQAADLSKSKSAADADQEYVYEPRVELWDIYVPSENRCYTFCPAYKYKALRSWDWEGPEDGPYVIIAFNTIPNNVLPLPPIAKSYDVHEIVNVMARKTARQAARQKDVTLVPEGAEEDGRRTTEAEDSDVITVADPNSVQEKSYGGVHPETLAAIMQFINIHSRDAGNIDAAGGLGPQSSTVGQDKMIDANSSKRINDMEDEMKDFALSVVMQLAHYLWYDPLIELPLTKRVDGTNLEIPVVWTPEDKAGDFIDYNFEIEMSSMQEMTPQVKYAAAMELWNNVIMPMLPMLQQQQIMPNFQAFIRELADLLGISSMVDEILIYGSPPPELPMVGNPGTKEGGAPMQPPVQTKKVIRESRSTATPQGQNTLLANVMMGAGKQPKEMAQMGKPTGY